MKPTTLAPAWRRGWPPHVSFADVRRDLVAYRRLRCRCGARMLVEPQQRGRAYRILARCGACHRTETF